MTEKVFQALFLRCEYLVNPLGIDVLKPRLSWVLESEEQSQKQTSYHILVASSKELLSENKGDLWDTKQVNSDQCNQIIYEGKELGSQVFCYWKVKAWDKDGKPSEWSEIAQWSMGLLKPEDWKAKWIGERHKKTPSFIKRRFKRKMTPLPLLRKSFSIKKKVKKAIIHLSALGDYELRINGNRIGDHILSPEWTDYFKRIQYQTYDITNVLKVGNNAIGAILGDGWYSGHLGPGGIYHHGFYGVNRILLLQLSIHFDDETLLEICSDLDWKMFLDGPIRYCDHFMGEFYDCTKELDGWDTDEFDDTNWSSVFIDNSVKGKLVAQKNEPIRIVDEFKPVSLNEPKPNVFIFDMGQNFAGWIRIRLGGKSCNPNTEVKLRHGEWLESDGTLYTENLRKAEATDTFIIKDIKEREYEPHFTYHGFQYLELTGLKSGIKPDLEMITGCVIASDTPLASSFESSDEYLNKLWHNIFWTQRGNLISVPTDCPQRDERMGWMGDAQVYSQTSMFMMDMAAFYTKWMQDIKDSQRNNGRFADFVPYPYKWGPHLRMIGSPAWADAGIIILWDMFLNYGDKRILEQHYNSCKRFINYIHKKNPNLLWENKRGFNYGDWLNGDKINSKDYPKKGAEIPKKVFATIFFAHSSDLISKMAEVLKRDKDKTYYENLATKIKTKFIDSYVESNGKIEGDTQAGYALALNYNMLSEESRPQAVEHLVNAIKRYDRRLSTGFCSTLKMMNELEAGGKIDLAYELLFSTKFPSWFYMLKQGATTMWERWDSFIKERGFASRRMTSFNHYAYGSIGEWIYRNILGINIDEQAPGFKHIIIKPQPGGPLKWAKGYYNSIYGNIEVEWKLENEDFIIKVGIPVNTTATVYLPTETIYIDSGKYEFKSVLKK